MQAQPVVTPLSGRRSRNPAFQDPQVRQALVRLHSQVAALKPQGSLLRHDMTQFVAKPVRQYVYQSGNESARKIFNGNQYSRPRTDPRTQEVRNGSSFFTWVINAAGGFMADLVISQNFDQVIKGDKNTQKARRALASGGMNTLKRVCARQIASWYLVNRQRALNNYVAQLGSDPQQMMQRYAQQPGWVKIIQAAIAAIDAGAKSVCAHLRSRIIDVQREQTMENKTLISPVIGSIKPDSQHILTLPSKDGTIATTDDIDNIDTSNLATKDTEQTLSNKTLDNTCGMDGFITYYSMRDDDAQDTGATGFKKFHHSAMVEGELMNFYYNLKLPAIDKHTIVATTTTEQTFENKTLTAPIIASFKQSMNGGTINMPTVASGETKTLATTDDVNNIDTSNLGTLNGTETLSNKTLKAKNEKTLNDIPYQSISVEGKKISARNEVMAN